MKDLQSIVLKAICLYASIAGQSSNAQEAARSIGCSLAGAAEFNLKADSTGTISFVSTWDFTLWQQIQSTLAFRHIPPDMHNSSVTLAKGASSSGHCQSLDSDRSNIACILDKPTLAGLIVNTDDVVAQGYSFLITAFAVKSSPQTLDLSINYTSLDQKIVGTSTASYPQHSCVTSGTFRPLVGAPAK
jgi:hypothetical protein